MKTLADAESAYLEAKTRFEKWVFEFERNWNTPVGAMTIGLLLSKMNPQQHAMLRAIDPVKYDNVIRQIKGARYGKEK